MAMRTGAPYPAEKLNEFWELVLINQFHDILPGTSIAEVYVDSDSEYGTLFSTLASANGPWHSAAKAASKLKAGELKEIVAELDLKKEYAPADYPFFKAEIRDLQQDEVNGQR